MAHLNDHYFKLAAGYLFPEIARRVREYAANHPKKAERIIRCGIGDVTEPLPAAVIKALHKAVDEMAVRESFRGYGPEQGYPFLREAISQHDYQSHGIAISAEEIFVSDGSKCDTGNILDILGPGNRIGVADPVYPVYVDTNVMAGNTGPASLGGSYEGLIYLPCVAQNGFVPEPPPGQPLDVVYLCFPNNPTGATATRHQLETWVEYAIRNETLLLFDAAYEAFIQTPGVPHSIYEIPGAERCSIEFRSFSKNGGFTGLRCAYSVVPRELTMRDGAGEARPVHPLWLRRSTTKFNGVSYPVQRAAEALYSPEGMSQVGELVKFYMENAAILRAALSQSGLSVFGGIDAPYLWVHGPSNLSSWEIFDRILNEVQVVVTPGSGFGAAGEGYFRVSAFNSRQNVEEAGCRLAGMSW